jgi:hypothetical protein
MAQQSRREDIEFMFSNRVACSTSETKAQIGNSGLEWRSVCYRVRGVRCKTP